MNAGDWNANNVLCVRLDNVGDVLMTTPALRALKHGKPGRRLTLLTSPAGAAVAALVPEVDEVIAYDAPWMKATAPRTDARPDLALVRRLHRGSHDAAVIFTVYSQNPLPAALVCFLAGIPRRLAHCRENPYQLLTHWVREPEPEPMVRHEVRRQLDLVAEVGCTTQDTRLSLRVPEKARLRARGLLRELGLHAGRPWLAIHPGASAPSRRYPPEHFARAAGMLARDLGFEVVFTASAAEVELVETIRDGMRAPSHSLAGRLDLAELAGVIEAAPLLIANNSGPAHVAAAVGTPVVDLYALTNPQHTPWGVAHRVLSHDVPCKNCCRSVCPEGHHDCLRRVPPEAVVASVCDLLGLPVPSPSHSQPLSPAERGEKEGSPLPAGEGGRGEGARGPFPP